MFCCILLVFFQFEFFTPVPHHRLVVADMLSNMATQVRTGEADNSAAIRPVARLSCQLLSPTLVITSTSVPIPTLIIPVSF